MKKTYIIPALEVMQAVVQQMLAGSITSIGGNSGLDLGEGEAPAEADAKENSWDIWEE